MNLISPMQGPGTEINAGCLSGKFIPGNRSERVGSDNIRQDGKSIMDMYHVSFSMEH